MQALDWNGDGRDDLLLRGTTNWLVAVSQGDSVGPLEDTGIPHENAPAVAGRDLDGDGLEDIAIKSSTQIRAAFATGRCRTCWRPWRMASASVRSSRTGPLTDAAVHTAGSTASWPDPHLQTNDLVVTRLRATDGSGEGGQVVTTFRYEGFRAQYPGPGIARIPESHPDGNRGWRVADVGARPGGRISRSPACPSPSSFSGRRAP